MENVLGVKEKFPSRYNKVAVSFCCQRDDSTKKFFSTEIIKFLLICLAFWSCSVTKFFISHIFFSPLCFFYIICCCYMMEIRQRRFKWVMIAILFVVRVPRLSDLHMVNKKKRVLCPFIDLNLWKQWHTWNCKLFQ